MAARDSGYLVGTMISALLSGRLPPIQEPWDSSTTPPCLNGRTGDLVVTTPTRAIIRGVHFFLTIRLTPSPQALRVNSRSCGERRRGTSNDFVLTLALHGCATNGFTPFACARQTLTFRCPCWVATPSPEPVMISDAFGMFRQAEWSAAMA